MLECFSFFGYNVLETITEIKMDCIYNDDDKKLMKLAAQAKNKSRLQELIDFAKSAGYPPKELIAKNTRFMDYNPFFTLLFPHLLNKYI